MIDRTLALAIIPHVQHGAPRAEARAWAEKHDLLRHLTKDEVAFLDGDLTKRPEMSWRVEAVFVLAWALGLPAQIDPWSTCDDGTAAFLPIPIRTDDPRAMARHYVLRPPGEILPELDLYYCLSWLAAEQNLTGARHLPDMVAATVWTRRTALEWLTSSDDWDEVTLDT